MIQIFCSAIDAWAKQKQKLEQVACTQTFTYTTSSTGYNPNVFVWVMDKQNMN